MSSWLFLDAHVASVGIDEVAPGSLGRARNPKPDLFWNLQCPPVKSCAGPRNLWEYLFCDPLQDLGPFPEVTFEARGCKPYLSDSLDAKGRAYVSKQEGLLCNL